MEFVNGGDLCSLLKNLGYLSEDVAVNSARPRHPCHPIAQPVRNDTWACAHVAGDLRGGDLARARVPPPLARRGAQGHQAGERAHTPRRSATTPDPLPRPDSHRTPRPRAGHIKLTDFGLSDFGLAGAESADTAPLSFMPAGTEGAHVAKARAAAAHPPREVTHSRTHARRLSRRHRPLLTGAIVAGGYARLHGAGGPPRRAVGASG